MTQPAVALSTMSATLTPIELACIAPMSIRALQVFAVIAEGANLREAGEALFLDASTVSKLLTRLERALGAQLVLRTTRSVTLTTAGRQAVGPVQEVLAALEKLTAEFGG